MMLYISHRGNLDGLNPEKENSQSYIDEAIKLGFDVEVDVWRVKNKYWLGHDEPQYETTRDWLFERRKNLWIHCKNFDALTNLLRQPSLNVFYHEREQYTIISNGLIWAHNIQDINNKCIIPLLSLESVREYTNNNFYGVCSDFVFECQQKFGNITTNSGAKL